MKVLIVRGVAGGASAAARLRRLDEGAEIILFEKGPHISFANCGLPYYLGGVIDDERALLVQTPAAFNGRFCVDVRVMSEVVSIDRAAHSVHVKDSAMNSEYDETYDKLILSPGADAIVPGSIPGTDLPGVFTLRNVPDTMLIEGWLSERKPARAVVVGGGAIGVELAENLARRGVKVTVAELADHIIASTDREMAYFAEAELTRHGVDVRTDCTVESIKEENGALSVVTDDGALNAGIVLLCLGVTPNSALAKAAGLKLGVRNCIAVDDGMHTSDPDIFAVGDATESTDFITGEKRHMSLAGPANRQGRIAADQIAGSDSRYRGTQGSSIVKVFDIAVASTGETEAHARALGLDVDKLYLRSGAHAGYYPGAKPLTVKIIFEKGSGRLIGGQFIGEEGADKRCDVLATAIRAGLSATDLKELELCYAPPYSSAKDPINMAGFAIENILTGKVKNFHWDMLGSLEGEDVIRLDVRTAAEYASGSVPGFINIPLNDLRARLSELPREKRIYVHCLSGLRSYVACRILTGNGYDCYNISGGYIMYTAVKGAK